MVKNAIKCSFFVSIYGTCGGCKDISGKTQGGTTTKSAEILKKELEELNIDDNEIISIADFISSGAKFDSSKNKVKFDDNSVVNVTKFAEKFKKRIPDLSSELVCDNAIEDKLKVFIDRIIECLKTKLKEGYNLDDNALKKLCIVVEFKSDVNLISDESLKFTGNLQNNMSNFFKKGSNVYIMNDIFGLPIDTDKGIYSSKTYDEKNDKNEKNQYLADTMYLFKDKNNKEATIDPLKEKSGANNYYAIINLKDYKDYIVGLKKN